MSTEAIVKSMAEKMQKSLTSYKSELAKLRTGRAHPSLLDHIKVEYYGNMTPISQVASISVEDARTLLVTPWEKQLVSVIEKAIMTADLGLNPNTAGTVIRIPLPPLTEERRRDLVKIMHQEAENAKISMRNVRREANQSLKVLQKEKTISEDQQRSGEDDTQKQTDHYINLINQLTAEKEKELMSI